MNGLRLMGEGISEMRWVLEDEVGALDEVGVRGLRG